MKKIVLDGDLTDLCLKCPVEIAEQIEIWENYFFEYGNYKRGTVLLDGGWVSVVNPWTSSCGRFEVNPIAEYGLEEFKTYMLSIIKFINRKEKRNERK